MQKIIRAIQDPRYAAYVLFARYMGGLPGNRIFAHLAEYRSDSENGRYAAAVTRSTRSQRAFENFKRGHAYREILEHVSQPQGLQYLDILKARDDGILERGLETVLLSDAVGNPVKYRYDRVPIPLSPTTLRYLKVTSDIGIMFGDDLGNVAEIGGGYGGQALVNDQILTVRLERMFDLPFVNELVQRYLNSFLLNGAYVTTSINQELPRDYDLVISNYAFSELPRLLQIKYIDKVLSRSRRGYLTMNSGFGGTPSDRKLSVDELRGLLPEFELFEEEPLTAPGNYIIAWGHDRDAAAIHFTLKD